MFIFTILNDFCVARSQFLTLDLEEMTTEGLHDSEDRMKNFQCLLEEINEEASIQMDRIKQLCETLPDDNDLSLNLEIEEDVNQSIEHVGLESETAKQMQANLSEETSEERQSGIAEVKEELIEAINSVIRPRPRPSASSSPGLSSTVRIVNEIPEDKDEPRIIQAEDIATDSQQNEENIQREIATSEDSQKESQALGILFADTLLKYLDKRTVSGKENFKWDGSLTDLKSLVELVLKLKGKWAGKKSGGKQTFQGDKVSINWWPSKKTLHVQGSPDFTEQVEEQLDSLHKDFKQKVASNDNGKQTRKNRKKKDQEKLETGILSQNTWSSESPTKVKELNRSQPVQREIEAIWSQLLEIKQLVINQANRLESSKPSASVVEDSQVKTIYSDPSIITGAPGADLQCEQAKKICTKAGNTNLNNELF